MDIARHFVTRAVKKEGILVASARNQGTTTEQHCSYALLCDSIYITKVDTIGSALSFAVL